MARPQGWHASHVNSSGLSAYGALTAAVLLCALLAVVLTVASPSVPAAPLQPSGRGTAETRGNHTPLAANARACGEAVARERRTQASREVLRENGLDRLSYLPLVLKGYPPPPAWSGNARFGFGEVTNPVEQYDVSLLHADWYVGFGFDSDPPPSVGLEYAQTIRLCEPDPGLPSGSCWRPRTCASDYSPGQAAIVDYARSHAGTLWLVGNEPDAPGQDCITPQRYAELYHELHGIIKRADPTAQIAIGGIVQATPLRLQYLDLILQAYDDTYDAMIPVDVWNVHGFILPEEVTTGAGIPPGTPTDLAVYPNIDDHDNMTIFGQQMRRFRQWMRDRGERNKPLIVSEYGILYPVDFGFDEPRVESFMLDTFDYFRTRTSSTLGYPDDANKLVQAWCWYSLDDSGFESYETYSHLFDPHTKEITRLGTAYGNYAASAP